MVEELQVLFQQCIFKQSWTELMVRDIELLKKIFRGIEIVNIADGIVHIIGDTIVLDMIIRLLYQSQEVPITRQHISPNLFGACRYCKSSTSYTQGGTHLCFKLIMRLLQ